jgi:hypothetical protein
MIINKLETMERIVQKNKNLIWDGWNIIDLKKSEIGRTSPNGIRVKNEWYLHRVYEITSKGWDIPNKYRG